MLLGVCKGLYYDCMRVLWNAVFYDPVADCCVKWLKRKRWSAPLLPVPVSSIEQDISIMVQKTDANVPEAVCFIFKTIFFASFSTGLFYICFACMSFQLSFFFLSSA